MITKLGLLAASEAAFKLKLFDNTAAVKTTNVIDKHPEVVTKMNQWIEQVRSDMGDWGYEGRNQRPAGIIDEPFPRLLK